MVDVTLYFVLALTWRSVRSKAAAISILRGLKWDN